MNSDIRGVSDAIGNYELPVQEIKRGRDEAVPYATEVYGLLVREYSSLEANGLDVDAEKSQLGEELFALVHRLASIRHAARGVALTLVAYKAVAPGQDIRAHKSEHLNGFSARSVDNKATVKFLQAHSLQYNVESHWLSQTFSFAGAYADDTVLKTTPKAAGEILPRIIVAVQRCEDSVPLALAVVRVILAGLINERNLGKVLLEKPKDLSIDQVIMLLTQHFQEKYTKNSPRLPQLAMYAIYSCIVPAMNRYNNCSLLPLERMKAANRKSGSVGDVDVLRDGVAMEAVEVKFGIKVSLDHVNEAIAKIRTESVERYLILSTAGIEQRDIEAITQVQSEFRRSNGCEVIVNGVMDSIKYYLRLIKSTSDFVIKYTKLVEDDDDLGYEHRLSWNKACADQLT